MPVEKKSLEIFVKEIRRIQNLFFVGFDPMSSLMVFVLAEKSGVKRGKMSGKTVDVICGRTFLKNFKI